MADAPSANSNIAPPGSGLEQTPTDLFPRARQLLQSVDATQTSFDDSTSTTRRQLIYLLGPTCVGKSAVIELALKADIAIGCVMVGKMMRAKYPPSFFKGQGAPAHTQREAQQMMWTGVIREFEAGNRKVIVDGQPRTADHVQACLDIASVLQVKPRFVLLHARRDTRSERAGHSRKGEVLDLALQRMDGDVLAIYDVLAEIIRKGILPEVVLNNGHLDLATMKVMG